jgi:hypothetical protein
MNETRELLERVGGRFDFPPRAFEGLERRRHRKRRNQRITAGAVGIAVFVTMVWIATTGGPTDRTDTPAVTGPPRVVSGPTGPPASTRPADARRTRTVEGISFSLSADRSWVDGPIKGLPEGGFREGNLLISKSIVGPQGAEGIIFWTGVNGGPRAELCGAWRGPADDTVADLAAAVATAPGIRLVRGPSDVTIGGYPAKHVVVIAREDVICDPGFFYEWYSECWGPCWTESNVGDTIRVWIVDVDGTPLFLEAETSIQANHYLVREIQRIVASIRFG